MTIAQHARHPHHAGVAAVAVLAVFTLAGCTNAAAPAGAGPMAVSAPANAQALQQAYVSVVATVLPSVVQITTTRDLGSGIVMDDKGDIVTNDHVVGQATKFQVRLANSPAPVPATLVGAYPPDDLAVIHLDQLPSPAPKPAHFGDSAALRVGDIVLAMGNPLGLTGSVTDGIVSATGRTVSEPTEVGSPGATLPDVIQTSASINPGNSGGALVGLSGDVVGVPTLAAIDPQLGSGPGGGLGGGSAAPGIGFAIPSNVVTDIAGQLIAHDGHVVASHRAELGVQVVTVVDLTGQPAGVGVESVIAAGPAAGAGVQAGDVIAGIATTPVHTTGDLTKALAQLRPGQRVPVTLTGTAGATRTVMVTLGQLPGT
jgi:putative serine protease PepD